MSTRVIETAQQKDLRSHTIILLNLANLIETSRVYMAEAPQHQEKWVRKFVPCFISIFDFMEEIELHRAHFVRCVGEERAVPLIELVRNSLGQYWQACTDVNKILPFQFEPRDRKHEMAQTLRDAVAYMKLNDLCLPWPRSRTGDCFQFLG